MRFPFQELHGLEDAQRNFEALQSKTVLDTIPQSFLQLATVGTRQIAFGSNNIPFPNAQTATATAFTHGLGVTPVVVLVTVAGGAFAGSITFLVGSFTSTQFTANAWSSVVINGNVGFYWIAIG